eukprot:CAMPEP_0169303420 /NCGR_PEP_ID=MMETSP1016-20121227/69348_1 /TAXON_ID=342587 /ORGANISM="Karlodinium micrum, Strain CCMP2283" /LENGTH=95 /DNA_ID=CAMNT_0009396245 /DNA_START=897 /DNA_END=1181 /DNA_ORIENTATION=-
MEKSSLRRLASPEPSTVFAALFFAASSLPLPPSVEAVVEEAVVATLDGASTIFWERVSFGAGASELSDATATSTAAAPSDMDLKTADKAGVRTTA